MFSKMTLIFEKSSLVASFGLGIAVCGVILFTHTIAVAQKISKKTSFILLASIPISLPMIALGLMIIINSDKVTLFLARCSEYLLALLP